MATIQDVSRLARVSTATVSAVLNGTAYVSPKLTARVREAVRELDYTINAVARGLQLGSTRTIGMLVPNLAEPVYSRIATGVEERLRQDGYSLVIGSTHNDPAEQSRFLSLLSSKQLDGVLLVLAVGSEEEVQKLLRAGHRVVLIARRPRDFEADEVSVDHIVATEKAIGHLLSKGHARIGLLLGPRDMEISRDRIEGWRRALVGAGLTPDEDLIVEGDYTAASGERAMEEYLALQAPPTAVFATGFLMLTGCLAVTRRKSLIVPTDFELMTWSDSPLLDVFDPPVSSIEQPSYEMGTKAANLILERLGGDSSPPRRIILPTDLKIREGLAK